MANKMLIDALHPEETRVVALRGNRVEDFDFESASKKPLRGNIYLAKVTRVEPSLQAAFIEYGGNRHGFLAFSEIHPDYYQIPVADRQALIEEETRAHREADEDHRGGGSESRNDRSDRNQGNGNGRRSRRHRSSRGGQPSEKRADLGDETLAESIEQAGLHESIEQAPLDALNGEPLPLVSEGERSLDIFGDDEPELPIGDGPTAALDTAAVGTIEPESFEAPDEIEDEPTFPAEAFEPSDGPQPSMQSDEAAAWSSSGDLVEASDIQTSDEADEDDSSAEIDENGQAEDEEPVEQLGGDAMEDATYRAPRLRRHYKIQEVIKRRQILLVQVVKEERGNKGAALTTYLSLAGRYSVLMPNTARGGGISRKITDSDDRRRLKAIAQELEVPEGMGIILRTAGAARGETEVKRDFEYLLRMWETVRELTLSSSAPKLVYEEGSLIKRTIRDLYSKEVDELWVSGEAGYREAREYMRLLMPSHAKNVHLYTDPQPIFAKSGVEAQLDAMFSNHVTLKSGGYIVINQTEALVAIDVNSGRSTREHNIEDTAVRTNLEAADEVARQLRLRDLAGLIVVDFIDMEEGRNNRAVERRIKDALKNDRARIQIGHISHFGLLEMSRQRIRTGVLEGSTVICPHCAGAGTVRSTASIALHVLRVLEDTLIRSASHNLLVRTRTEVALYMLNQKRANLTDLEQRFGVTIVVMADAALTGTVYHAIERGDVATPPVSLARTSEAELDEGFEEAEDDGLDEEMTEGEPLAAQADGASRAARGEAEGVQGDKRRRRRRRRRGRDRDTLGSDTADASASSAEDGREDVEEMGTEVFAPEAGADVGFGEVTSDAFAAPQPEPSEDDLAGSAGEADDAKDTPAGPPRRRRGRRSPARSTAAVGEETLPALESASDPGAEEVAATPRRSRRARGRAAEEAPSLLGFEAPSADRDIGADTAQNHPADVTPDSMAESTQPVGLADLTFPGDLPAEPVDVHAETPGPAREALSDEPPRPKRSGWWQRAKATLTGE